LTAFAGALDPSADLGGPAGEVLRLLTGDRPALHEALARAVDRLAGTALPVLVEGEPGTGRAVLARTVHEASPRGRRPLVVHRPGAALRPALAQAAGSSLLVAEVADLAAGEQAELLERLRSEAGPSVRLLARTARDVDALARAGFLLEPLVARLRVLAQRLPPLRAEPAAIVPLLRRLLARAGVGAERLEVADAELADLAARGWPGNAAELDGCARLLARWAEDGPVTPGHVARYLAAGGAAPGPAGGTLEAIERDAIAARLAACGWHQGRTAASLGIDRKTLYRKVRRYGLHGSGPGEP